MKANELSAKDLMIGDWVYLPSIMLDDKYPVQVLEIQDDCIKYYVGGKKMMVRFKYVEPIPLTPEILEKNGWVYIAEDKVFYPKNLKGELPWIYYITDGSNEVFRMKDFCNLQYVHQLQHALRLCGIKKEIKL